MTSQNKSDMTNCAKSVSVWSYCGPHFPPFGLNMETYSVSPRIQSKCGKMRTRITPNTDLRSDRQGRCSRRFENSYRCSSL